MELMVTGLPALAITIGFIVIFAAPVWFAAKIVGAKRPTLGRAIMALVVGNVGAMLSLLTGFWALLLIPLSYLWAFKYTLGTSWAGALLLAILAALGYGVMMHLGGGHSISPDTANTVVI